MTDELRRFFVAERREDDHPHFAIVDRRGFLPERKFYIGTAMPEKEREKAVEVAKGRNTCELNGTHVMTDSGECEVCDATTTPEVVRVTRDRR